MSICFLLFNSLSLLGACKEPFSLKFSEIATESIKISWIDNNNPLLGYQLAYGLKGIGLTQTQKTDIGIQKFRTLTDLNSGTAYIFWIRAVCAPGDSSKWEGPFSFITALTNPSACGLNLELRDNNCDNGLTDVFNIQVTLPPAINPYKLQSVSLIATHPWPADLVIWLESPQGNRIALTERHGTVDDNYGMFTSSCDQPTVFSDDGCLAIAEGSPPFTNTFKPDEAISNLNLPANPSGLWKLAVCDGAINDKGILKYLALNFIPEPCNAIETFFVSRITHTSFEVRWEPPLNCKNLEIHYQKTGDPTSAKTVVVNCGLRKHVIQGLDSNAPYEFFLISSCLASAVSAPSCTRSFQTSCAVVGVSEGFEDNEICTQNCGESCTVNGVFSNNPDADNTDWLLNEGETPTDFTGPSSGVNGGGKFLYLESNPSLCQPNMNAYLESKCLKSGPQPSACDLDFYFHMYGKDTGRLRVEISLNNGASWAEVFSISGDQGNQWNRLSQAIELPQDRLYLLRFNGQTATGSEGDIAIDLISLGNTTQVPENVFYEDKDLDGYGNADIFISRCSSQALFGYSLLSGDCDDNNSFINPAQVDLPCNQIDENCDGVLVLTDTSNPMMLNSQVVIDETCFGKGDGSISLSVSGGALPIKYNWLHGDTGNPITGLEAGFYKCKITDVNGCGLETSFIEVKSMSNFQAIVESVVKPSCQGKNDGIIKITHNGVFTPFSFQWSRGDTTQNLSNVGVGIYGVTITNGIGCKKELGPIEVKASSSLQPIATFLRSPLCYQDATGIIELNVVNGFPPYTYNWEDGFSGNRRSQLTAGLYVLTITDASSCSIEYVAEIPGPEVLELAVSNLEDVRCFGTKTGQIRIHVSGGTEPYTYAWNDNGSQVQFRPNLTAGNYGVTVYDDNGCTVSQDNIIVRQPPELLYSIDKVIPSGCLQKPDGAIQTSVAGGVAPYKYFWSSSNQNTGDVNQLIPGAYTMTAVDANNCKITTESILVTSGNIVYPIVFEKVKDNKCPSEESGLITARSIQSKLPLDFNWSNGTQRLVWFDSDSLKGLPGGIYRVTITDSDGCISVSPSVSINSIPGFTYSADIVKNLCNTDSSATITLQTGGASLPHKVEWQNGSLGFKISQLRNGSYNATVTDELGCHFVLPAIAVGSISDISIDIISIPASIGNKDGSLEIVPSGGQGNYTIQWSKPSFNGFKLQGLGGGDYQCTITDELGCQLELSARVDEISGIGEDEEILGLNPNPTSNVLFITHKGIEAEGINIIDLDGKEFKLPLLKLSSDHLSIDVTSLSSGLYFLKLKAETKGWICKFIKI
ncbi:MAG: fibronectin type III domain-containing protein [Saprospiraceae bacterium]|nr:fibronectin type III domain-containing protein [Saprospiraceae bacterium]